MSYVQKHPKTGVYRVRKPIPDPARHAFQGRAVYLKSLGTKDLNEAKRKALPELADLQSRIDRAIHGEPLWATLDMDEVASWLGSKHRWSERINHGLGYCYPNRAEFLKDLTEFAREKLPGISQADLDEFRKYIEADEEELYPARPNPPEPVIAKRAKRIGLSELETPLLKQSDYEDRSKLDTKKIFGHLREVCGARIRA